MMKNFFVRTFLLMGLAAFSLTACKAEKSNEETASGEESASVEVEGEKETGEGDFQIEAIDLKTKEKLGGEILTEEINVVFVWQPACPPCETELKLVEEVYRELEDIHFIGLAVGENEEELLATVEKWGLSFDNYRMPDSFLEKYKDKIKSTPTVLFLDKDGNELREPEVGINLDADPEKAKDQLREKYRGLGK